MVSFEPGSARRATAWLLRAGAAITSASAALACSTPATLEAEGGTCAQATDCSEGLICIHGQCSSNLSAVESTESDAGGEAGGGNKSALEGGRPAADATALGDSGGPGANDAGTPIDSGALPSDAAPPAEASAGADGGGD